MYGIVDAAVVWYEAAQHPGICRIYYGICRKKRNVPLPEINIFF
jgi:hypothetical protein